MYKRQALRRFKETKIDKFQKSLLQALKEDDDEDRHFALSLVPSLKALTEDDKFIAKIEILKLLRNLKLKRSAAISQENSGPNVAKYGDSHHAFTPQSHSEHVPNASVASSTYSWHTAHPIVTPPSRSDSNTSAQSYITNFVPSPESQVIDLSSKTNANTFMCFRLFLLQILLELNTQILNCEKIVNCNKIVKNC